MFAQRRSWAAMAMVFGVGLLVGGVVRFPLLWGEDIFPVALSTEQRSAAYAKLAREVEELERTGSVLKTVVRLVGPTVVHIDATKPDTETKGYGRPKTVEETGSGVVIQLDNNHYILTNVHVVKNTKLENITIKLQDRREISPTNVWLDESSDVAVLAVSSTNLTPARLGDSSSVEIGDFVLAVGSPFGLSHSVTYGIISAKGRRDLDLGDETVKLQDFLQTDAAINPGNSGGPLMNLRGEVIGINTAIASNSGGNEGIGFSIPVNMAMSIARQLIQHGKVKRAMLGVVLDSKFNSAAAITLGLPTRQGARVRSVNADSPAAKAGIIADDVILMFNGVRVEDDLHLINMVSLTEVGVEAPIIILRNQRPIDLKVRVGAR